MTLEAARGHPEKMHAHKVSRDNVGVWFFGRMVGFEGSEIEQVGVRIPILTPRLIDLRAASSRPPSERRPKGPWISGRMVVVFC